MEDSLLQQVPARLEAALRTIEQLQDRLNLELSTTNGKGLGSRSADQVRMATQLADAATKLGRETRAWASRVRDIAHTATLEEKLAAVQRFIEELPAEVRNALVKALIENFGAPPKKRGRPPGAKNKRVNVPLPLDDVEFSAPRVERYTIINLDDQLQEIPDE